MTVTDCPISVNNDDWYVSTAAGRIDGSAVIRAQENNFVFPHTASVAYGDTNTSTIPTTDVISSAVLHFYVDSRAIAKGITMSFVTWMLKADESLYFSINTETNPPVGAKTVILTAGEIAEIDLGASQKTRFKFIVNDPGSTLVNLVNIRAKEYGSDSMFLRVTHAPPFSQVISIMS